MAAFDTEAIPENPSSVQSPPVDSLSSSLAKNTIQDVGSQAKSEKSRTVLPPIRIYTRPQILFLYNSPLIQLPPDMPELKDWFGDNEPNVPKRDVETTTSGNGRDRRFRRDAEDGELPPRPSFRSTLSQPSQMGNFKHQSLRPNDRDRDGEKDRQRDIRDREGQEKLRHLSDKYDRERNKERDTAPHLTAGSSSKVAAQPIQTPTTSSRRVETRETAKKKAGETSEDWRKGAEPRTTREDRSDAGRKERGERERPKSRVRDSSRSPREHSSSRRDREDKDRDRLRSDRDREDLKRDRERDPDHRDGEIDDPRRWRDDGKRDERMAARRGDRHTDQYRDRDRARDREATWESPGDRRWLVGEERDGRSKKLSGRERKSNAVADEGKEERRDREKEKEKEPAWMDTYIPPPTGIGILGSKGTDGELDGIQAWKKGMKEKELKDKATSLALVPKDEGVSKETSDAERSEHNNKHLDEIQLFKLLMKREEEKKQNDTLGASPTEPNLSALGKSIIDEAKLQPLPQGVSRDVRFDQNHVILEPPGERVPSPSKVSHNLSSGVPMPSNLPQASRIVFNHPPQDSAQGIERMTVDPVSPQFNPPPGSRLLAFARMPSNTVKLPSITHNPNIPLNGGLISQAPSKSDTVQQLAGFTPFEEPSRSPNILDDHREANFFINPSDGYRRGTGERIFSSSNENGSLQDTSPTLENGGGYSATKGSRFAKFFDGKGRENATPLPKAQASVNFPPSPSPGQRQDSSGFVGLHGGVVDHRAMDDIYAMLNSSAQQNHRASMNISNTAPPSHASFSQQSQNNAHFQHPQVQLHHQQHQQHQQQMHSNRLEPLYESRHEDRSFVPDGMVPGLRSVPPPRSRENTGIYSDGLEDTIPFNVQRLPPHQQRGVDPLYSGPPPPLYSQQAGRTTNIPLQQNHYRGGPSPNQPNSLQGSQQRLPPGLANLGGRPPHEPSQFMGMPGMPSPGLHAPLHLNGHGQGPFNNFVPSNNLGYGGSPQVRGPHPMQNTIGHHPMSMGHPNNLDARSPNHAQLLGVGGINPGGLRVNFSGQGPPSQIPLLAMRQQQQQQLPVHMLSPLLPPHIQQQGLGGPNSQPAHDLMTLLMGGSHRE
ncbi:hypothetical protein BDZ94DRAFT_1271270 [Collybia nuda]|uniref:Uncharacterized protein n=1 Tax=Collybia nuda TaxID=64659 RepID=A0A9P6CAD6_9AGAR|nr:hypothetical protein BDZ94DRAFT_1271270 [Collybia nuda]